MKRNKINLLGFINHLFCKHDYHLVNQFEMKSEFDIIVDSGKTPNTWNSLKRKTVTDYKCSKCKRIKRLTVTTSR